MEDTNVTVEDMRAAFGLVEEGEGDPMMIPTIQILPQTQNLIQNQMALKETVEHHRKMMMGMMGKMDKKVSSNSNSNHHSNSNN